MALRVGEEIGPTGPTGYYDMTPESWRDWCLKGLAALREAIEDAPHGTECASLFDDWGNPCDCWKARVPK